MQHHSGIEAGPVEIWTFLNGPVTQGNTTGGALALVPAGSARPPFVMDKSDANNVPDSMGVGATGRAIPETNAWAAMSVETSAARLTAQAKAPPMDETCRHNDTALRVSASWSPGASPLDRIQAVTATPAVREHRINE